MIFMGIQVAIRNSASSRSLQRLARAVPMLYSHTLQHRIMQTGC